MTLLQAFLQQLLAETAASRVTLRQGEGFPVTHEVCAAGVPSLRGEQTVDLRTQPVAIQVASGQQVVQNDSRGAFDDPEFQRMLDAYGGIAAQVVTPVVRDGDVIAILSVHQLGERRRWTDDQIARCREIAQEIARLL